MKIICAHCRKEAEKPNGAVNRARASGLRIFCGRKCAGKGRRKPHKPKAQRVAEKRAYDMEYRRKNRAMLKAKKAAHFRASYDPEAARIERKKRAKFHAEYCRRPSYKLWKAEYDRRYRAREYGEFADAFQLTIDLNREIKTRSNNYEIRQANQTGNKSQKREREAQQQERRHGHPAAYGL
ncbi:MAG: hypothetical protein WC026_17195 [Hyphomicrobium sp.]|uniref:hypothetical protein n=1 Tax=Hyphomicrobium sp. TaxID=82 RepID=UPI003566F162